MKSMIDDVPVPIECPHCKRKITKSIAWLESHSEMTCTCGQVFKIDPSGFRSARKAAADIAKTLSRLDRKR